MITYPISFFSESKMTPGIMLPWNTEASGIKTTCAVPKEFEGSSDGFSPEDFFALALQNCFMATFKVFAEHSKLEFKSVDVRAELVVDLDDTTKRPVMKQLKLSIDLSGASDETKAGRIIKKTLENGFILQSIKTQIIHEIKFS
ncbi:MAG: OsmC family protein [Bacteriovoracaceae bacterium]|nr:OsmC family protein [Bacteriovoracaceae bacterium]